MALQIGSSTADGGMTKAIFDKVDELLSPPLQDAVTAATDEARPGAQQALEQARAGWRLLAFAIATGVIEHLAANMEISGVTVAGTVTVPVTGATGVAPPAAHAHPVALAPAVAITLAQNNNGPGRVS